MQPTRTLPVDCGEVWVSQRRWSQTSCTTYLLDDYSEDDSGVDLGLLRDADNGVVDCPLFGTSVANHDERVLLVAVEHGIEVHPGRHRREVGSRARVAVVGIGGTVATRAVAESRVIEAKSRRVRNNRP